nr:reverse transcriptase domain-containing protein [Tanacetum cinerariifolium]
KQNFNGMSIEINKKEKLQQLEQWANLSTYPSKLFTYFCYDDDDDDEDYTIAVTPSLSTEELDNSLSMRDEHLDTIPATESDEFIKSSVEDLILIPSESKGIPDNALPPDSELVSSEVMEIIIPEVGGIDDDILLTIKDDILREKLLNINRLIAKIEALNDNPAPSSDFMTKSSSTSLNSLLEETNTFDNSLPEFETFCFDVEEISSGSKDSNLNDSIDQTDLANLDDNFVDPIPKMFTDEHTPDYSSPLIFDVYDDDFLEVESDADNVYDDPFDSKGEKIKETSSKLTHDQTSNPTSSTNTTPKGRTRRSSKQKVENSNFEEHLPPVATMADNRTMAEMLRAPTEGCAEAIVVPPILTEQFELKHSLINMMTSNNSLDSKRTIHMITFVGAACRKLIASQVKARDVNSNSEIAKLTHAVNQQTSTVTTAMTVMLKQLQANPPPALVKAVEEACFTCRSAHPYYQCLTAGSNTFPEFKDNIQG